MNAHRTTLEQAPEHEFEAALGLPEPLPPGERILWQGAPDWRVLAREALHVRSLAGYFGVLLVWRGAELWSNGATPWQAALGASWLLPLAAIALSVLALMAWLISRTSVYTLTDKRVVMRIGVVLSLTFNLPYTRIESAALRSNRDGSGDLSLVLDKTDHIAYVHLWPHARPWRIKRTQPMLRALPDARAVATVLSAALANAVGATRQGGAPVQVPVAVRLPTATVPHAEQQPLAA